MYSMNDYKKVVKDWENQRKAIREKNEQLIKEWRSIPWWKFWEQVPFEEQRAIILRNWDSMPLPPEFPPLPYPYTDISIKTKNPNG